MCNSKPTAEENASASAGQSDVVTLTALVHEVLSLTRQEQENAARRELRLSKELQMATKRLGDLEEEVHALRSAIALLPKSKTVAQPSRAPSRRQEFKPAEASYSLAQTMIRVRHAHARCPGRAAVIKWMWMC